LAFRNQKTDRIRRLAQCVNLAILALVLTACSPKMTQLTMEPLEFAGIRTADGVKVQTMDPELLFNDGAEAFKAGDFDQAARFFSVVCERFPDSSFGPPALFNLGLARLRHGRPADAATAFRRFLEKFPGEGDIEQVRLRLAEALLESGDWAAAESVLGAMMVAAAPRPAVELEIRAGLARALRKQGRLKESMDQVDAAMQVYDRHLVDPDIKGNFHAAMASFEGGEVWHDLFASIKFILPKDRMEKDLSDKGTMFIKAQAGYMRTVRVGNIFWASKAGVRIGQLYEEFYDDIMKAEVPPELDDHQLGQYMAELRRQARPLLSKSIELYERNMKVARSYGAKDEWFADMKARLDRLKELLKGIE